MDPIKIIREQKQGNSWTVFVEVGEDSDSANNYSVQVDEETYDRLTNGMNTPGQLVEETFRFLLEREPKESILPTFDLDTVSNYFPEYEQEISGRL